jgi:hypothetical protein
MIPKLKHDKFAEIPMAKFPEQIQWKLYRANQHFREFERKAAIYMNKSGPTGPGKLVAAPTALAISPLIFTPVPSHHLSVLLQEIFSKIFGQCLITWCGRQLSQEGKRLTKLKQHFRCAKPLLVLRRQRERVS